MGVGRSVCGLLSFASLVTSCGDDSTSSTATTGDAVTSSSSAAAGTSTAQGGPATGTGGAPGSGGQGGTGDAGGGGAGGGGASAVDDAFRSGTRLRAIVLDGGGDARAWTGWHDSELDFDCYLDAVGDGSRRCLPQPGSVVFLDDQCTQPAIRRIGTCDEAGAPDYISDFVVSGTGCDATGVHEMYRAIGPEAKHDQLFLRYVADGACVASSGDIVRPAERVDTEAFAEGELVAEPIDGALERLIETYADGAMRAVQGHDVARDADCVPLRPLPPDGADFCVPPFELRPDSYQYWEDDTCGAPVVTANRCSEGNTTLILDRLFDACGDVEGLALHERGTFFEGPLHETFNLAGECYPQPSTYAFRFGPIVPYQDFPTLEPRDLEGDGVVWRVPSRAGRVVGAGYPLTFHDADGRRCYPYEVGPDTSRCVPDHAVSFTLDSLRYGDAACTAPIVAVDAGDPSCADGSPIAIEWSVEDCDNRIIGAYDIGEAHVGPVYERIDAETCLEVDVGTTIYGPIELGANVLDELPLLTTRVE